MVAVVSGNGLGLFNTSLTALGGTAGGAAGIGQGRDAQYVNVATGNLVLQDRDEALSVRGFNAAFLRTYNSQGTVTGQVTSAGQDGWVTGYERSLTLQDPLNTANSKVTLTTGDGQTQEFKYTGTANNYRSMSGDGAHDTLVWNGTAKTWTLTEGSSRREELYADHASATLKGRLTRIRDLKSDGTTPAQFDIVYDSNNRVWEVRSIDGAAAASRDALVFTYQGTTTQLTSVLTREGGTLKGQVWYEYDAQGRLNKVTTDLTPDTTTSTTVAPARTGDNAWNATAALNNGKLFQTTYTYVTTTATDLRIASVTQSDGTVTSYTYDASSRVSTVTLGSGADAQTTTFTYGTGTTDVTMTVDGVARTWTYQYDANKQLTGVLAPATGGQRDTTNYTYEATTGDVTAVIVTRNAVVVSQTNNSYDANGNLTWQWTRVNGSSASATAVQRTYSATNQLLKEDRYIDLDQDGPGGTVLTQGLTTTFLYDTRDRLRFVVDATGVVTERVYATTGNGIGQVASERRYAAAVFTGTIDLATLTGWATAAQKASSQLTGYTYDAKGRLTQANAFATVDGTGAGVLDAATDVTRYTYDTQGLLRQQILIRGTGRTLAGGPLAGSELTDYVYDGLGRLLTVLTRDTGSAANDDTLTVATTYAYTDSARQIVTTMDSGATLTRTQTTAGQTKTAVLAGAGMTSRTSTNYYNAAGEMRASEDAAGGRRYFFYDAKGRLEAEVDATGAVVQYTYDGADRRLGSIAYANRVVTTTWVSAGAVVKNLFTDIGVVADAAKDRVTTRTYDAVGRLLTETDGAAGNTDRQITTYTYDGASRVTTIVTTDSVGGNGRTQRFLYDAAGRQVAAVDAQNFVTETIYDAAGRVASQVRYANASATSTATTLAALRPTLDASNDQTTRFYYNGRGQVVGTLDAEGYLTEVIVDAAGNNRTERRYAKAVTWALNDTLTLLRTKAMTSPPTEPWQDSRQQWNGLGQLATQTNAEGTVSKFYYDEAGRLVRTETAANTSDVRDNYARYNAFGEVIAEMSGEQVVRLATDNRLGGKLLNDPTLTPVQLDDAFKYFGTTHSLDAVGRRIESTDPLGQNTEADGNKTFYFYDAQGRQTFAVRGIANGATKNFYGEVTETRYTAFGDVQDTTVYTGRIIIAGQNRAGVQAAIGALTFSASLDSRRSLTYTARGLVATQTDAMGVVSSYTYNAFGQVSREVRAQATGAAVTIDHAYNARGLESSRTDGVGSPAQRAVNYVYDAFGRRVSSSDPRDANNLTNYKFDRLGRQTQTNQIVRGWNEVHSQTFDAFARVLTSTDARGFSTLYSYSDTARSVTVQTPEGVTMTTVHNRHGETTQVTTNAGTTTYTYDDSGRLISLQEPGISAPKTWTYDLRGLLAKTSDASGRKVDYTYDAAGRVLTRIEDPLGTPLTTTYTYDGQGRAIRTVDASGRITDTSYDREGRMLTVAQDPAGLNVRTSYTWDEQGRQLTVVEGAGTPAARTTQYVYDALGRRTSEIQAPGSLNLTTNYVYDKNDNVVSRTDASARLTRYYYDEANRLVYTVDPAGGLVRNWYDANGQVTFTHQFTVAVNAAALTGNESIATLDGLLNWNGANGRVSTIRDKDGRVRFQLDGTGGLTETFYDASNRVVGTRSYANALVVDSPLFDKMVAGTALPIDIVPVANDLLDQVIYQVYDAAGRITMRVTGVGGVTAMAYDNAGRLVQETRYSHASALTTTLRNNLKSGTASGASILAVTVGDSATDQVTYHAYDGAGRERYAIDATNSIVETIYDSSGKVIQTTAYSQAIAVSAALRTKLSTGDTTALADIAALLVNRTNLVWDTGFDAGNLSGFYGLQPRTENGVVVFEPDPSVVSAQAPILARNGSRTLAEAITFRTEVKIGDSMAGDYLVMCLQNMGYEWMQPGFQREGIYIVDGQLHQQSIDGSVSTDIILPISLALNTTYVVEFETHADGITTYFFQKGATRESGQKFSHNISSAAFGNFTYYAHGSQVPGASGGKIFVDNYSETTRQNGQVSAYRYDAAGRLIRSLNSAGQAEEYTYDASGRRVATTDARGGVSYTAYDAAGRAKYAIDTMGAVTESIHDAAGRIVETRRYPTPVSFSAPPTEAQVAAALSNPAPYAWSTGFDSPSIPGMDLAGLLNAQVTGGQLRFQGLDQPTVQFPVAYSTGAHTLAEKLTYRTELTTGTSLTNMHLTLGLQNSQGFGNAGFQRESVYIEGDKLYAAHSDGASNTSQQMMTLAVNTTYVVEIVTADGQVTTYVYAKGSERANGISFSRSVSSQAWGNMTWLAAGYNGPGWGSAAFSLDNFSITAAPTLPRETFTYDAAGRITSKTDALGNIETYTYDGAGRRTAVTDARGYTTYSVYDAAGRLRLSVDPLGQVQETLYDAVGRAYATRGYVTTITVDATLAAQLKAGTAALAAPAANDAADARSYRVFDAAGRVRFVLDATNAVQEMRYDAAGRVVETLAYATALADATLINSIKAGTATDAGLATFVATNAAGARASYNVYDAAGRVVYTVMRGDSAAVGIVNEWRYDGLGQVIAEVRYAKTVTYTPAQTAAQLAAAITADGGNDAANQRLTRIVYDADGHERYRIDDANAVTEQRYNALGQVVETRTYAAAATISAFTLADVASAVSALSFRHATFAYDLAGRLTSTTNALGKTESYGYDALGQRTSLTNRLGQTWTYAYDAAGRLVEERSPPVMVARYNAVGALQAPTLEAIVTRMDYDALGNVISRTEAFGTVDARMTRYVYDSRGNQIKTLFPNAGRYNEADGRIITSDTVAPETQITYDALGRAAVQKDVRGNLSYKVYNALGQVAFDIDAEGYVTGYAYNAYGEQTDLRRYATKANLALASGWTTGTPLSLAQASTAGVIAPQPSLDRVLTTAYDLRGNKVTVWQSAVSYVNGYGDIGNTNPVTTFEYDAYGNLAKESVLLEDALNDHPARWATTFHYYDELGRREMSVDAEGYVTTWSYNVLGEVIQQKQYARAISTATLTATTRPSGLVAGDSTTGMDRVTDFTYDALGRKISESTARMFQRADGSGGVRSVINGYTYDDVDHVTRVTVDGIKTDTAYDALGRATSVTEEARQVLVDNWQTQVIDGAEKNLGTISLYTSAAPYTAMTYDAFGNVVRVLRSAQGVRNGTVTPTAADQVSTTRYDFQGRALVTVDASGKQQFAEYDAADNLVKQSYWVSGNNGEFAKIVATYDYDKSNRQTKTSVDRYRHQTIGGTPTYVGTTTDRREAVRYNAFGEVTAKANDAAQLDNVAQSAQYEYDLAGHMVRSNADGGAYRSYGFNLAGHQQTETRDWTDGATPRSAIYSQATDRLGRAVRTTTPSYGLDNGLSATTTLRLDRWGNVLEQIDARGYSTQLFYNDQDKVIRQVAPLVKVLSDTGVETWIRPETRWMYDAIGRLVGQTDANGNTRKYEYNPVGQLQRSVDANGQASRQAYDTFGQVVGAENALGYLTYVNYDAMGRAVEQGDFLPDTEGDQRVRTALQRFGLDGNGNRLTVTDALNNVQRYDYDSEGRLLRSETPTNISRDGDNNPVAPGTNVVMTYAYDVQGRKTLDQNAYANLTWTYDYFGRATAHKDLGNVTYTYAYDSRSGLQTGVTQSTGATRVITYNANGSVRRVTEGTNVYAYEYDSVGNRISEETLAVDGEGKRVHIATSTSYDSNNRIARIVSDDRVNLKPNNDPVRILDLSYDYDAVGNRRRVIANTEYGPGAAPVYQANLSPIVIAPPQDANVKVNSTRTWTVRASDIFRDPEGAPMSYALAVNGAGTMPGWLGMTYDPTTGLLTFVATNPTTSGEINNLKIVATDAAGAPTFATYKVSTVVNTAPVVADTKLLIVGARVGSPFSRDLRVTDYFRDFDIGDAMSLSISAGLPAWMTVETLEPGLLRLSGTPTTEEVANLTMRAVDENGAAVTRLLKVNVTLNTAPAAVPGGYQRVMIADRNSAIVTNLSDLFVDAQSDEMIVSATMENDDALPAWLSFQYADSASPATVRLSGTPPLSTPNGTVFRIKLTATDTQGMTGTTVVEIRVDQNHAPTLLSTIFTQNARVQDLFSITISLANRFNDADGDAWVHTFANTDPRGSWLTATFNGNNTVTLTGTPPDNSKSGDYAVGIRATDPSGASVILPINLHVVGRNAPTYTANSIAPPSAYASVAYSYQFPANAFVDIDGDALAYTAALENGQPLPGWLTFNPATRTFAGTPPSSQTVRIKVTATEPANAGGGSASGIFDLTILAAPNYAPTVNAGIPGQNATPTVPASGWSYAFPANAFADGDALTYSIVSGMPGWMTFTPGTRTFSGTPSTPGSWTITVRATDTIGQTVQTSFVVTTPNVAPVVTAGIGSQANTVNTPWNFTFPSNTFADGNNQALTYTATGMPAGISFNASTRTFSGTPSATGSHTITVTASDGTLTASTSFTYTVNAYVNQAPVYLGTLDTAFGGSQQAFSYTVSASAFSDPNGDTLTYSVSGLPSGLSFNPATMQVTGTLPRFRYDYEADFTVTVTDPAGLTASGNVHCYMSGWGGPMGGFMMVGGGEFESQAMIIDPGEGGGGPGGGGGPVTTGWGNPTQPGSTPNRQELWFTYDGENRAVVINGKLEGGVIKVSGDKSWSQTYDAVGNVVGKITLVAGVTQLAQSGYTLRKELSSESHTAAVGTDKGLHKTYTYDNAGRLGETREYYALGTSKQVRVREADGTRYFVNVDVGGWLRRTEKYYYEADGSLRLIDEFARVQGWAGAYADTGNGALDAAAILAQKTDTAVLSKISAQAYFGADFRSTYDLAGRVAQNFYHHVNNAEGAGTSTGGFITTYTHTYVGGEGWLETQVTGDVNVANYRDSSMTSRYDAWGRRVEMTETTPLPDYQTTLTYKRYFSYDLDGGVLSRRDGDWKNNTFTQIPDVNTPVVNLAPDFISNAQWTAMTDAQRRSWMAVGQNQRFVYSNGQQVARLNEAGKLDVTTAMTAFDSSSLGSSMVAVNDGDTLQSIAQRTYGNASLWYILAEANAVTDSQLFTGQMLKAPDVTTNKNDSTTFKPYNPAEIMGPTEPGTPYIAAPPAQGGNNCAMMIVMIVAVVVTAIVAPYLTGIIANAMSAAGVAVGAATVGGVAAAAAGGFVGGLAGSIASQVVGKALGVVDHFSLRSAVSSGIATGLTAGLAAGFAGQAANAGLSVGDKAFSSATVGGAIKEGAWGRVAMLAVGNAATGYVGNKIAGIQGTTFSWKSIAASAASSVITSGITNKLGLGEDKLFQGFGKFSADFAGGMVGSVVSLHVRRAAGFDDKVDYGQMAMDAFGNSAANSLNRGIASIAANKATKRLDNLGSALLSESGEAMPYGYTAGFGFNGTSFGYDPETSLSPIGINEPGSAGSPSLNDWRGSAGGTESSLDWSMFGGSLPARTSQSVQVAPKLSSSDRRVLMGALNSLWTSSKLEKDISDGELISLLRENAPALGLVAPATNATTLGRINVQGDSPDGLTYQASNNLRKGYGSGVYTMQMQQYHLDRGGEIAPHLAPRPVTGYPNGMTADQWRRDGNRQLYSDVTSAFNTANSLGAPTIYDARLRGRMPTTLEGITGTLKYVGNLGVALINAASYANPGAWVARAAGQDPTISPWTYSDGEVTQAAAVEGGLILAGPLLKALQVAGGFNRAAEADRAVSSLYMRTRVEANLAESAAARRASRFDDFAKHNEWPPNNGFIEGSNEQYTLWPGQSVDRFGSLQGTFAAEYGTSYSARALKPGSDRLPYHVFEVTQPIEVMAGPARGWFGYAGGGTQYKFDQSISQLLARGALRKKQ